MLRYARSIYEEKLPYFLFGLALALSFSLPMLTSGCATFEGATDDPDRQAFIEATGVLALQYMLVEDDYEHREALRMAVRSADTYLATRYPLVPLQYATLYQEFKADTVGTLSPEAQTVIALLAVFGDDLKGLFE